MPNARLLPASLLILLAGCGSATMMLKGPISDKCSSAGLEGCPDMSEGILLYVGGEKEEARMKLQKGIAANAPAKLKEFAESLKTISSLPGASSFGPTLLELSVMLSAPGEAPDVSAESAEAKQKAAATAPSQAAGIDKLGSSVVQLANGVTRECSALGFSSMCSDVTVGPLVITDLHIGSGCPDELFVLAGDEKSPTWFIAPAANAGLEIHGARYVVRAKEMLSVGVRGRSGPSAQLQCAVTWAGYKP